MATTKRRTTTRKTTATKQNKSLPARTARSVRDRPYTSAAIATGTVAALAAFAAGAWFFRNSDKSFGETADDLGEKIKDGISEAKTFAEDSARSIKDKASAFFDKTESQTDIAEEALALKERGARSGRPLDPAIDSDLKTGAISY